MTKSMILNATFYVFGRIEKFPLCNRSKQSKGQVGLTSF
jgi:hypothetical protein